jgi:hypothetical protein
MGLEDNIFLVSDASYSYDTKVAGLGVVDLNTGKEYLRSQIVTLGSHRAEYIALVYSVFIAIEQKYSNVVFVYDNKNLDLTSLEDYVSEKIEVSQFLWLKREYVHKADRLASKARKLREKLQSSSSGKIKFVNKSELVGKELLYAFKERNMDSALKTACLIAKPKEKKLVQMYLDKNIKSNFFTKSLDYKFINFVYYLLPRTKQIEFYKYLVDVCDFKLEKSKIVQYRLEVCYINKVQTILQLLKNSKSYNHI